MSRAYPGGILTANPPTTTGPGGDFNDGGTASGVWTMADASRLKGSNLWPSRSKDKALYAWGWSNNGALGNNLNANTDRISSPVQIGSDLDWIKVNNSAGEASGGIKSNYTLYTWGQGGYGAMGTNDTIGRSTPGQVGSLTEWADVVSAANCLALKTNGTIWSWGKDTYGNLGRSTNNVSKSSPVQIGSDTNWAKIYQYGGTNSAALKTDGSLYMWGSNYYGQLAQSPGGAGQYKSSPVQVSGTWSSAGVGYLFSGGIKSDGSLWLWGYNNSGQGGQGIIVPTTRSSPVQVAGTWSKFAIGHGHVLAIRSNGTLWAWGYGLAGELGDSDPFSKSSPIQVGALTDWSTITAHDSISMAIKTNGTLWVWGAGINMGMGLGDRTNKSSPVQIGSRTDWAYINGKDSSCGSSARFFGITAS